MPAGDAQRTWFPEMITALRREWRETMSCAEPVELRDRLDAMLQVIRSERDIHPPMMKHPGFSAFAGPPVQPGALESLESQARYIARPAMAMDALRQQPDGTLAMETPPDPRTGATLLVLDPLSVDSSDRDAYSRSRNAHPTLPWRLLQPSQGYRQCRASEFRPRLPIPLCRRRLGVCPRNTSQLGPLIKEDLRSRPSLVLVRRRDEDRLHHYPAPDCRPHSAASPERALPGPRSLRIPRAAPDDRTLPVMTFLSIRESGFQSGAPPARSVSRRAAGCCLGKTSWREDPVAASGVGTGSELPGRNGCFTLDRGGNSLPVPTPLLNPWISQPPRLTFPLCPLDRMSYK